MKYILPLLLSICSFTIITQANSQCNNYTNDKQLTDTITAIAGNLFDAGQFTGIYELRQQLSNKSAAATNFRESKPSKKEHFSYEQQKEGVLIIAKLYLCDQCPKYHIATASGFVLNNDGVCVTNHHVFKKFDNDPSMYLAVYAIDHNGTIYPINKILAADEKNDLALFKVESNKALKPLILGNNAQIGDEIKLISHPDKMYYTYGHGQVTRHYINEKMQSPRQSISADFAKGSSGAPVFDKQGAVVGIISSTRSVYYRSNENLQMVVKDIVPVSLLKEMCQEDLAATPEKVGVPGMRP